MVNSSSPLNGCVIVVDDVMLNGSVDSLVGSVFCFLLELLADCFLFIFFKLTSGSEDWKFYCC